MKLCLYTTTGLADPYALLQVIGTKTRHGKPRRTKTKYKTLNPVYNEDYDLYVLFQSFYSRCRTVSPAANEKILSQ